MKWLLQLVFMVVAVAAECAAEDQSNPLPPPPKGIDRHYFEKADDAAFASIGLGFSRKEVRSKCKGREFPPFETIRGEYFVVAVDYERSGFFNVPNFRPQPEDPVDFFFSGKSLLLVSYDKDEIVVHTVYWKPRPPADEKKHEPQQRNVDRPPSSSDLSASKFPSSLGLRG